MTTVSVVCPQCGHTTVRLTLTDHSRTGLSSPSGKETFQHRRD